MCILSWPCILFYSQDVIIYVKSDLNEKINDLLRTFEHDPFSPVL